MAENWHVMEQLAGSREDTLTALNEYADIVSACQTNPPFLTPLESSDLTDLMSFGSVIFQSCSIMPHNLLVYQQDKIVRLWESGSSLISLRRLPRQVLQLVCRMLRDNIYWTLGIQSFMRASKMMRRLCQLSLTDT